MFASDGHCHRKTDPFGIARGLCAKKTLRKSTFQELIRNASKSQLTTPKKQKVRANQSQTGPCQSERTNHRVLHPLKKTFAMYCTVGLVINLVVLTPTPSEPPL